MVSSTENFLAIISEGLYGVLNHGASYGEYTLSVRFGLGIVPAVDVVQRLDAFLLTLLGGGESSGFSLSYATHATDSEPLCLKGFLI